MPRMNKLLKFSAFSYVYEAPLRIADCLKACYAAILNAYILIMLNL